MAKKTPEEIFLEAQKKAREMYGQSPLADPQFREDVVANATNMARGAGQGAMNLGNQLGSAMESAGTPNSPVGQAGTALRQGIYDMRTGGVPAAPYVDANQAMGAITGQAGSDIYRAQHPSPYGMNISDAPYVDQAVNILRQAGQQINESTVMPLVEQIKAMANQAGQQIQQAPQKGLDWARGLLQ